MPQTVRLNHAPARAPRLQRLLYVEDDPGIQAIVRLTLEELGRFTVLSCSSGHQAVTTAAGFRPDLMLLDVIMPEMDGPATLVALRRLPELATVPVIFMTAKNDPRELADLREMGAIAIIGKPFDPVTLCDEIRDAWAAEHTPSA
ncbi:MAG TPA: response regulator [Gammaproteobacteria bacterium]|nr:response regulator [Gammaproteobacteria bacterium]